MSRITDRAALMRIAEHGAGTDERVTRYADGYGRWYAEVPDTFAAPILAARAAIRYELFTRSAGNADALNQLSAYVRKNVRRSARQDRPGYVLFEEA